MVSTFFVPFENDRSPRRPQGPPVGAKRGSYVRSRPAAITVVFKPESLLGAEALAVFFGPDVGRESTPDRRHQLARHMAGHFAFHRTTEAA
jgi:hypothetical protein